MAARWAGAAVTRPEVILYEERTENNTGDIIHFAIMPKASLNNVGSGGTLTNQAITITDTTLTMSTWKEATVTIDDRAVRQSQEDLFAAYSEQFGRALKTQMDIDVLALHTSITTNTVGQTTAPLEPLSDALILLAIQKLDDLDIPQEDRTFIFAPAAKSDLLKIDRHVLAYATGLQKGVQITGLYGELYGNKVITTSAVATSSGIRKNFLMHKEAVALGLSQDVRIQRLDKTALNRTIVGDALYGVAAIREGHACILNTGS